jgi:hypothetical protein
MAISDFSRELAGNGPVQEWQEFLAKYLTLKTFFYKTP